MAAALPAAGFTWMGISVLEVKKGLAWGLLSRVPGEGHFAASHLAVRCSQEELVFDLALC